MEEPLQSSKKELDFFLPGMITIDGEKGLYPAISITGTVCHQNCLHCKGSLLKDMLPVKSSIELTHLLYRLEEKGMKGVLISGGSFKNGSMPWEDFLKGINDYKGKMFISAHSGMNVSEEVAIMMRKAGIRQALIDVVGDKKTMKEILNLDDFSIMRESLKNLYSSGLEVVPHIIIGLYYGKIKGEYEAAKLLLEFSDEIVVPVVIMPIVMKVEPPPIDEVLKFFSFLKKHFRIVSLGCARPRGVYRYKLEKKLIERGLINRLAIWSEQAKESAKNAGYKINYHYTCCSIKL